MKIEIGDYIKANSHDGYTNLSGRVEEFTDLGEITLLQSNGTYRYINPKHFDFQVFQTTMTLLEVELKELIEKFQKKNWPPEMIVDTFAKVLEGLK